MSFLIIKEDTISPSLVFPNNVSLFVYILIQTDFPKIAAPVILDK